MYSSLFFLFYLFYLTIAKDAYLERGSASLNLRPIIGILDQPSPDYLLPYGKTYITASYVKWVEASGGRVVPVPHQASPEMLEDIFNSINGLLLTGGSLDLSMNSQYYKSAEFFYKRALEAFSMGDYFPIWGTCQGLQLLCIIAAHNESVDQRYAYDSENLSLPLLFTDYGRRESRMFSSAPADIMHIFESKNVTINLHHDGVDPALFSDSRKPSERFQQEPLSSVFALIASNVDRKWKSFVSVIEGKLGVPFYGVQFHPERNAFEWDPQEDLCHSSEAVRTMQYLGRFLLGEAARSEHRFATYKDEQRSLIYRYSPRFTGNISLETESFPSQQTYVFNFGDNL